MPEALSGTAPAGKSKRAFEQLDEFENLEPQKEVSTARTKRVKRQAASTSSPYNAPEHDQAYNAPEQDQAPNVLAERNQPNAKSKRAVTIAKDVLAPGRKENAPVPSHASKLEEVAVQPGTSSRRPQLAPDPLNADSTRTVEDAAASERASESAAVGKSVDHDIASVYAPLLQDKTVAASAVQELKDLVKTIPSTLDKEHLRSFARLIGLTLGRGHTSMSTEKMWADIQAWADDSPERVWNLHELRCVTDSTLKRLAWQTHGLGDDTAVTRSKLATKVAVERRTIASNVEHWPTVLSATRALLDLTLPPPFVPSDAEGPAMLCLPCDTNFVGWTAKELKRFATQCLGVVTPTRNNSGVEVKAVFRKYRERVGTRSTREEMETWSREKLNAQAKLYGIVVYPSFSSAHLRDEIEGFHVQVANDATYWPRKAWRIYRHPEFGLASGRTKPVTMVPEPPRGDPSGVLALNIWEPHQLRRIRHKQLEPLADIYGVVASKHKKTKADLVAAILNVKTAVNRLYSSQELELLDDDALKDLCGYRGLEIIGTPNAATLRYYISEWQYNCTPAHWRAIDASAQKYLATIDLLPLRTAAEMIANNRAVLKKNKTALAALKDVITPTKYIMEMVRDFNLGDDEQDGLHFWCTFCDTARPAECFTPDDCARCTECHTRRSFLDVTAASSNAAAISEYSLPEAWRNNRDFVRFLQCLADPESLRDGVELNEIFDRVYRDHRAACDELLSKTFRACLNCSTIRGLDRFVDSLPGGDKLLLQCRSSKCLLAWRVPDPELCGAPVCAAGASLHAQRCAFCQPQLDRVCRSKARGMRERAIKQSDDLVAQETAKESVDRYSAMIIAAGDAQQWRCAWCQVVFSELSGRSRRGEGVLQQLSPDRIHPGQSGGRYIQSNFQLLCLGCQLFKAGFFETRGLELLLLLAKGGANAPTDEEVEEMAKRQHSSIMARVKKASQAHKLGDLCDPVHGRQRVADVWRRQVWRCEVSNMLLPHDGVSIDRILRSRGGNSRYDSVNVRAVLVGFNLMDNPWFRAVTSGIIQAYIVHVCTPEVQRHLKARLEKVSASSTSELDHAAQEDEIEALEELVASMVIAFATPLEDEEEISLDVDDELASNVVAVESTTARTSTKPVSANTESADNGDDSQDDWVFKVDPQRAEDAHMSNTSTDDEIVDDSEPEREILMIRQNTRLIGLKLKFRELDRRASTSATPIDEHVLDNLQDALQYALHNLHS